jgi:hypothetical protein
LLRLEEPLAFGSADADHCDSKGLQEGRLSIGLQAKK